MWRKELLVRVPSCIAIKGINVEDTKKVKNRYATRFTHTTMGIGPKASTSYDPDTC